MKKIILLSIFTLALTASCKKSTTTPDPAPVAQTPTPTPEFSTFSSTIAVIDYTASTSYTASITGPVVAYIVAGGIRIDSLTLSVTKIPAPPPNGDLCATNLWSNYNPSAKAFKIKNGTADSLQIFENGVKVSSILIDSQGYNMASRVNPFFPFISGAPCSDLQRFTLIK